MRAKEMARLALWALIFYGLVMIISQNYHYLDQYLYPEVYYRNLSRYSSLGYGMIHIPTLIYAWVVAVVGIVSWPAATAIIYVVDRINQLGIEAENKWREQNAQ